jgi:hypothetical protein
MKGCSIALLGFLCLACLGLWRCNRLPSDAASREQFKRSRKDLERLREMAGKDYLYGRIAATYIDQDRLPADRVKEYRRLLKASGVKVLSAQGPWLPVEFMVDATGFLNSGTYKGFRYSEREEAPVAESLDVSCMKPALKIRFCHVVRRLDGNWWLFRYEYP